MSHVTDPPPSTLIHPSESIVYVDLTPRPGNGKEMEHWNSLREKVWNQKSKYIPLLVWMEYSHTYPNLFCFNHLRVVSFVTDLILILIIIVIIRK